MIQPLIGLMRPKSRGMVACVPCVLLPDPGPLPPFAVQWRQAMSPVAQLSPAGGCATVRPGDSGSLTL